MARLSPNDDDLKLCDEKKEVEDAITAKCQAFKVWKAGNCTQASYDTTKCIVRGLMHHACHKADKEV